jgi:hypothetical protein
VELELVLLKELLESGCELAAEDAAQCADRRQEASGRSDPSGAIGSETVSKAAAAVCDQSTVLSLLRGLFHRNRSRKEDVVFQVNVLV